MSAFQRRIVPVEELIGSQPTPACTPAGCRKRISVEMGARIAEGEHVLRYCRGAMTAEAFRHLQANPNARLPRDFWKNFLREEMQASFSKEKAMRLSRSFRFVLDREHAGASTHVFVGVRLWPAANMYLCNSITPMHLLVHRSHVSEYEWECRRTANMGEVGFQVAKREKGCFRAAVALARPRSFDVPVLRRLCRPFEVPCPYNTLDAGGETVAG